MIMSPSRDTSKREPEPSGKTAATDETPAAGPHAKAELTDAEKTPGAGTLPDPDEPDVGDGASS